MYIKILRKVGAGSMEIGKENQIEYIHYILENENNRLHKKILQERKLYYLLVTVPPKINED